MEVLEIGARLAAHRFFSSSLFSFKSSTLRSYDSACAGGCFKCVPLLALLCNLWCQEGLTVGPVTYIGESPAGLRLVSTSAFTVAFSEQTRKWCCSAVFECPCSVSQHAEQAAWYVLRTTVTVTVPLVYVHFGHCSARLGSCVLVFPDVIRHSRQGG